MRLGLKTVGVLLRLIVAVLLCVLLVACDTTGSDPDANEDTAATLDEALASHVAGRIDEARQSYQEVLESDPTNPFALYNLGLLAQGDGDLTSAEDFYRRSLAVDAEFEAALFNLAIVRAQLGDSDEAIELYKRVIAVNPENAGAHLNLGFLYLETGQEKKGNKEIQLAIEIDPSISDRIAPPAGATSKKTGTEASPEPTG